MRRRDRGGPGALLGATFTITASSGTCSVEYDQAGSANYNAAPQVVASVTVGKQAQSITITLHAPSTAAYDTGFSVAPLPDRTAGDPDFTVGATASSGLTVSFAASGQCTVSGVTVHLTGAGSCTITASQGGDANYAAAPDVRQSFRINSGASFSRITDTTATCSQFAAGTASARRGRFGHGRFTTPSAGTYYVAVQYLVSSVNGQAEPSPTTVDYEVSTVGRSGSTSGVDLKKQVAATPARAVRRTFLRALKH